VHRNWRLGPLVELRSYVEAEIGGERAVLSFPFSLTLLAEPKDGGEVESYEGSIAAKLKDGWHRVTGVGSSGWALREIAPSFGVHFDTGLCLDPLIGQNPTHEFATYWLAVDTSACRELLHIMSTSFHSTMRPVTVLVPQNGPFLEPNEYRFFHARELERSLHTGALEIEIRASCARLRSNIEERAEEYRRVCAKAASSLTERWKSL